jgi:hypothetical protein
VRVAPRAHSRDLTIAIVLACAVSTACAVGWGHDRDPDEGISATWVLEPSHPVMGEPLIARLTLRDREQHPVLGARLRLTGHMSHPGMGPVLVPLVERGEGIYEARLQFSMAGDWRLVVDGELSGGDRVSKEIAVPGVRPAS